MIPKLSEWPLLIRLGLGPAWRDRLPARTQARHRAFRTLDHAGQWLLEHDHYRAAALLWRALGVW